MKKIKYFVSVVITLVMLISAYVAANAYTATPLSGSPVSLGLLHSAMVTSDGTLYMWGENWDFRLGDGTQTPHDTPFKIMENVKSVTLDGSGGAVIKNDGSLWEWETIMADINLASPGDTLKSKLVPEKVMDNVESVARGTFLKAAVKTDGTLWLWGACFMPDGTKVKHQSPVKVMDDVAMVDCGWRHIAVVKKDGSLWLWGANYAYQIGDGTTVEHQTPYHVMDDVVSVSCTDDQTIAVKKDGSLWAWGRGNNKNAFGVAKVDVAPTKIMDDVKYASLGYHTGVAVKNDNSLWAWGPNLTWNFSGGKACYGPEKIMDNVVYADAGYANYIAVKDDGSVWVWGSNESGKLGIGTGKGNVTVEQIAKVAASASEAVDGQSTPVRLKDYQVTVPVPKCAVTLELDGGTGTTVLYTQRGSLITPPDNPYKDGYFFAGWYKDGGCTKAWNFDVDTVSENCTLYAKWEAKTTVSENAELSKQSVVIDGKEIVLNTYILRDEQGFNVNFVKLRDVAYLLNGTQANFNVDWRNNAIRLDKHTPYTTQNGAELTVPSVVTAPAKTNITPILTEGITAPLEAFFMEDENGGGHNYFKLRDIGKVAGFNVEWNDEQSCIVVTTTESYFVKS